MDEREEKVMFLKKYRVLSAKTERLNEMKIMYPDNARRYDDEIRRTFTNMEKTEDSIRNVDDGLLSEILFQKYLCGKSLETISYALNYSKRQIERLHIVALDRLEI